MATKGSSIPERVARWKVITTGLKPLLTDMPHLAELHGQLEKLIPRSEELDARSEALKAESREVNKTRAELAKTGDDLRKRLGAALKTTYGFQSEKLIEFGIKPQRPRGRDKQPRLRKTQAQPPTPADTAPHPGTGSPPTKP